MMAGTTEIMKKLACDEEPLAKRLCLAQNVFQTNKLALPRKEETVITWLCEVAGKFRKKSKRQNLDHLQDDVVKFWSTLQLCVSSAHMQELGMADMRPSTMTNIVKVLSKHLERSNLLHAEHKALLDCVISIFEASRFQKYFRTNVLLFSNFSSLLLRSLSEYGSDNMALCTRSLSAIQTISRQITLRSELCCAFLDEVLLPLITLLKPYGDQVTPLSTEVYKSIQQVFFPKNSSDFLKFFENVYKVQKTVVGDVLEDQNSFPLRLLCFLKASKDTLDDVLYVKLISTVFRAFVASYRKSSGSMIFQMFVTMSYLVGFEVKKPQCTIPYPNLRKVLGGPCVELSMLSLNVLYAMVFNLAQWSISTNVEMCGLYFHEWQEMLVASLFPLPANLSAGLRFIELMSALTKLNPVIVEPSVKNILGAITAKPLLPEERPAYSSLLGNFFAMFTQLGRIPTFVSVFLKSLQDGFRNQKEAGILPHSYDEWLPLKVVEELSQYATSMPSSLSIDTLDVLMVHFSNTCLEPHLHAVEQSASLNCAFMDVLMQCVGQLICAILKGVRMIEQCSVPQSRQRYCHILEELKKNLCSHGHLLLKEKMLNPARISSFLNVSSHWAAEVLLIEQYADVGREQLLTSVGTQLQSGCQALHGGGVLAFLHPYLTSDEWENIYDLIVGFDDQKCKDLLLNLNLQLLCALRMFDLPESDLSKDVAGRACELMVKKLSVEGSSSFNESIVHDVVLMSPLLSASHLKALSDSLSICLIGSTEENLSSNTVTLLTEERLVACGVICSVLSSLRRCLKAGKRKKDEAGGKLWKTSKVVLGKLDAEIIFQHETKGLSEPSGQLQSLLSSTASFLEEALSGLNDQEPVNGEQYNLSSILQHLSVLQSLPLAYLSGSSQALVFISLLSLALDCSLLPSSFERNVILKQVFNHLLLGLYEEGKLQGPNLEGCIDHGVLIKGLAHFVIKHNVARNLLELLLTQTIRQEHSRDQVLEKIALLSKKGKNQEPDKENLLLGTLLMQDLSERSLQLVHSLKSSEKLLESSSDPKLEKARKKLVKCFEALVEHQLVNPEEVLLAFALTLDFNLRFSKDIENLTSHLGKFCAKAVSFLRSNHKAEQKAAEALILTVLEFRDKLSESIPNSFVKDVWSALISLNSPSEALLTTIYQHSSKDEMSFILKNLLDSTNEAYKNVDHENIVGDKICVNMIQFWQILLRCPRLPSKNYEISIKATHSLFECLPSLCRLPHQRLLEFLHDLLSSKVRMDMEMADFCLLVLHEVSLPHTVKEFTPIAKQFLSVMSAFYFHRTPLVLDCIPSFMQMLQFFVKQLAEMSRQRPDLTREDSAELAELALGVEKLLFAFSKPDKKKAFKRVAAYFIADLMFLFESINLSISVKVHFQNMVCALLSILDDFAIKFLLRTMSEASVEIFKSHRDSYMKFHRFTGKV